MPVVDIVVLFCAGEVVAPGSTSLELILKLYLLISKRKRVMLPSRRKLRIAPTFGGIRKKGGAPNSERREHIPDSVLACGRSGRGVGSP